VHVAVELAFGRNGVLSTVTMARPYAEKIAAQLIRLQKHRYNGPFLQTVNFDLKRLHSQAGWRRGWCRSARWCDPYARTSSLQRGSQDMPMKSGLQQLHWNSLPVATAGRRLLSGGVANLGCWSGGLSHCNSICLQFVHELTAYLPCRAPAPQRIALAGLW